MRGTDIRTNIRALAFVVLCISSAGCSTPLHKAADAGDTKKVEAFLDAKAYGVNDIETSMRWTALHNAAWKGHAGTVRLLLDRGADVNTKDKYGLTPLSLALLEGHADVAKLLLDSGADLDSSTIAIEKRHYDPARKGTVVATLAVLQRPVRKQDAGGQPAATGKAGGRSSLSSVVSDIDEVPAARQRLNKNAYAIVIGIETYRQKLPVADFAVQDAKLMVDYLTRTLGYPEENVITLTNDRATYVDMVKYYEKWLPNNVESGSTVFIYYSGHGAPNPKTGDAYLVPYDGDPTFIEETGYSLKRLYTALGKLPAKEVIVAIDSCFSGAGGRSVLAKGARPIVLTAENPVLANRNITVLSASAGDQISSTYDEKGHGLFTYFMLKAIKEVDVVRPDGSLKVNDIYSYLKPQVQSVARKKYNNEQTPQLIGAKN